MERAPWKARKDGRLVVAVGLDPYAGGQQRWEAVVRHAGTAREGSGIGADKETALARANAAYALGLSERRRKR